MSALLPDAEEVRVAADRLLGVAVRTPLLFIGTGLFVMFALGMIVPSLAVHVRRLHDIGLSGWWLLLHFVAGIGTIMLFIMSLVGGEPGPNRYGPAPK